MFRGGRSEECGVRLVGGAGARGYGGARYDRGRWGTMDWKKNFESFFELIFERFPPEASHKKSSTCATGCTLRVEINQKLKSKLIKNKIFRGRRMFRGGCFEEVFSRKEERGRRLLGDAG
jgi:hypothetical protein